MLIPGFQIHCKLNINHEQLDRSKNYMHKSSQYTQYKPTTVKIIIENCSCNECNILTEKLIYYLDHLPKHVVDSVLSKGFIIELLVS